MTCFCSNVKVPELEIRSSNKLPFASSFSSLRGFLARLKNPRSYEAHFRAHLISDTCFNVHTSYHAETGSGKFYEEIKPFFNPCDSALGKIASQHNRHDLILTKEDSFSYMYFAVLDQECKKIANLLNR